jgi:hypothetical protein
MNYPGARRTATEQAVWSLPAALLAALFLLAKPLPAYPVPEGTHLLRNGSFSDGKDRPTHWVTRATGDIGTFEVTPPGKDETAGVLTITVSQAHTQPWMLELRQRLEAPLPRGRNLFLGFEYKLTGGYAFHVYWQKDSPPWPKFLSLRVSEPAGEWAPCMVAVPIPEELGADQTSLTLHLAEARGTLALRNLTAVLVAEHVDLATIETNYQPVFGGDYYDNDWRNAVLARIEAQRKVDLVVDVTAGGAAAADAEVTVTQTGRPFQVGVELPAALLLDELLEIEEAGPLKRALAETKPALAKFRERIGQPELFQVVTVTDAFVWRSYDEWGRDAAPKLLTTIRSRGQSARGHAAYIPAFREAPAACRRMERPALLKAIEDHVRTMVAAHKGQIAQWVVLHGMLGFSEIYDLVGVESMVQACQIAQQQDPDAALLISDPDALVLPSHARIDELIEFVSWLKSGGCNISGVVLGASLARPYIAPQAVEKRLDQFAASGLGIPVYIASLGVEVEKEAAQEAMLRDLLLLFYSHQAVRGVSLSVPWEPAAINRKNALYRADMVARKAGKMLENLLTTEWISRGQGNTGANGQFALRVFHGSYRISATVDGKTVTANAEVGPGAERVTLALE